MKTEIQLRDDVLKELKRQSSINAAATVVTVNHGVTTLDIHMSRSPKECKAVNAAQRAAEDEAVADEVEVNLPGAGERTDTDIALAVADALTWDIYAPSDRPMVTVRNGYVTLEGQVNLCHQKVFAENAVSRVKGVKGVINGITVKSLAAPADVKTRVEAALQSNVWFTGQNIWVEVQDGTVTLRGKVRSWRELEEAGSVTSSVAGVSDVENALKVEH